MRYAIVSDIHANRQGWEVVVNDISDWAVDATVCLGDIVGYGPMPDAVLESVCQYVDDILIGNHDAVIGGRLDPAIFGDSARRMIEWTQSQLDNSAIRFFEELPSMIEADGFVLAHAEILEPELFGYIDNASEARNNFSADANKLIFVGHTHFPEIFGLDEATNQIQQLPPRDFMLQPGHRYIVNVGSVGDPRDKTALASYCIYDDETNVVTFRHLPFDLNEYLEDMAERHLTEKPYFILCNQDTLTDLKPAEDWAMKLPRAATTAPAKPAKVIRISRSNQTQDQEQARQAEEARELRRALARSLRDAREEAEERRRQQAEAMQAHLRKKQEAAQAARRLKEEAQRKKEEAAQRKKLELIRLADQREVQRQRKKEAEAEALRKALEKKKRMALKAAEARKKHEEDKEIRAEKLRLRKIEIAKLAEQKRQEREKEKAIQAALIREKLEKKRQVTQLQERPVPLEGIIAEPAPMAPSPHETQEIVVRPREDGEGMPVVEAMEAIPVIEAVVVPNPQPAPLVAEEAMPDDPEERKKWIARRAEEKKQRRIQEAEAKKAEIRDALRRKREAARRAKEQGQ